MNRELTMAESVRRPRKKPGPAKPDPENPEEIEGFEEALEQEFAVRVDQQAQKIIDYHTIDRLMLKRASEACSMLISTRSESSVPKEVEASYNTTLIALLERVERLSNNDLPPYHICKKCKG